MTPMERPHVDSSAYFRGVEWLWALWLASAVGVAWATIRTFSGINLSVLRRFLRSERGAAYSFAYVMTFPIYVLLIVIVCQTTMLLITHMGVVYAAYAGVRSAIVWKAVTDGEGKTTEVADKMIRQAVVAALTPFASSSSYHAQQMGISGTSTAADDYYDQYIAYIGSDKSGGPVRKTYLTAKYRYAAGDKVTRVTTVVPDAGGEEPWKKDVKVTVTYNAPFDLPVVAQWLGKKPFSGASFYVLPLNASASLQFEIPKSEPVKGARTLGIPDPFLPSE